jgi:hypothetical protein
MACGLWAGWLCFTFPKSEKQYAALKSALAPLARINFQSNPVPDARVLWRVDAPLAFLFLSALVWQVFGTFFAVGGDEAAVALCCSLPLPARAWCGLPDGKTGKKLPASVKNDTFTSKQRRQRVFIGALLVLGVGSAVCPSVIVR